MSDTDQDLLRRFVRDHAQDAFTEIVRRHVNLVYSAALRQVRLPQLAEEVAQSVFADLARVAATPSSPLGGRDAASPTSLTPWLFTVTRHTAVDVIRKESRRQLREQIAAEMNITNAAAANWSHIEPFLDEAMQALEPADRTAILLRYFENKSLREVGEQLGVGDDAAQKRVSRAVERLREFFTKRGVTVGTGGLVAVITANAVQAAPVGLAATISAAAVLGGATAVTSTAVTAAKAIAMTTLQKTIIGTALAIAVGTGVFEAHQASKSRNQAESSQQQQAALATQIQLLQSENTQLSNQVLEAHDQQALTKSQFNELLKLRGQTAQARTAVKEMEKLKEANAQQSKSMPAFFTNAMAHGIATAERFRENEAMKKLARMNQMLHLTEAQEQAISNLMVTQIEWQSQQTLNAMLGKSPSGQSQENASGLQNEETEIKALLTPDQLADYPDFKQAETMSSAMDSAKSDLASMQDEMNLSQEQAEKVRSILYQLNLEEAKNPPDKERLAQARASGDYADVIKTRIKGQKTDLENKLNALQGILSQEQLKAYEQKEMNRINMQASAMKMVFPQWTNTAAH